jgi:ribonucleoside-diphosphate reductase alpha chain
MTTVVSQLVIQRHFTKNISHAYDEITWEMRDACIVGIDNKIVFEQRDVGFPSFFSQTAVDIVCSKYLRGQVGTPERETSLRQMIDRVVDTIALWGIEDGYFVNGDADVFADELRYILVHQMASFNSPVWFNVGVYDKPQASACFILDVEDDMASILEWFRQEGMIFKGGSGSGVNVSKLRAVGEPMSKGGFSSGPLSFMKAADAVAGSIKSGGTTRRAAKLVIMDVDHPDILSFITCKVDEEAKAHALLAAGFSNGLDGEAYGTVTYQNANNSVSVPDVFLQAVQENAEWGTWYRTTHSLAQIHKARDVMRAIAEATWACGDPGLFYYDTVNAWHTTPSRGSIRSGNPCQEFVRPPNEACNLASLNLLRFLRDDNSFDVDAYRHAVRIMFTAQEILVSRASYPTETIAKNSEDFRPLGLGYANLGALLMASGLPYDSERGRAYAAAVTALMTGEAYAQSARLAAVKGAFNGFETNRDPMLAVMEKHASYVGKIGPALTTPESQVVAAAADAWRDALELGVEYGYRNAQATLLAPTGTISFMMDCDTTGIEPSIALVSYKKLVGGGTLKQVNGVVERAMCALGWNEQEIPELLATVKNTGNVPRYLDDTNVFSTALGENAISPEAHIRMVAAVQPFLSGSVSKTVNCPQDTSVEDIERLYIIAWQLGLKSVAIYRDGCKATQPVTTQRETIMQTNGVHQNGTLSNEQVRTALDQAAVYFPHVMDEFLTSYVASRSGTLIEEANAMLTLQRAMRERQVITPQDSTPQPHRKRLPDERPAITHKFSLNGAECYMTVGLYPDTKQPGELFFSMAKEGSTVSGFMDAFGIAVSLALQYGVPLKAMADKFRGMRFEPSGFTSNSAIPMAQSLMDYIFRWLAAKFQTDTPDASFTASVPSSVLSSGSTPQVVQRSTPALDSAGAARRTIHASSNGVVSHAPICAECGQLMIMRSGSCFVCSTCGSSSGCS